MTWTVKTLKRSENDIEPHWVPIDPEKPSYDTYAEAAHACDDYRNSHPQAKIVFKREREEG